MIEPLFPLEPSEDSNAPVYRMLTPAEIQELEPDFLARGGALPDPSISFCLGAFVHGRRVAYQFGQLKLHIQPTKIEPGWSHLFSPLCAAMEAHILTNSGPQWVYCFAPEALVPLAESRGMSREPWVVLSKLVAPAVPARAFVEVPLPDPEDLFSPEVQRGLAIIRNIAENNPSQKDGTYLTEEIHYPDSSDPSEVLQ